MTETRREFSARKQDISNFQTNRVCNCRKRNFCRRSIFFINFKMAGLKSKQSVPHKKISEILPLHSGIIVVLSNK